MHGHCSVSKIRSFFKAACNKNRYCILEIVQKHKQLNASEIEKKVGLSQPTVSHHLKILCEAGALNATKKGKEVVYTVNENYMKRCCHGFLRKHCQK